MYVRLLKIQSNPRRAFVGALLLRGPSGLSFSLSPSLSDSPSLSLSFSLSLSPLLLLLLLSLLWK